MDCGLDTYATGHKCFHEYSEEYDAYYCTYCNKWLEDKCDDPTCEYCPTRPEQPIQKLGPTDLD